MLRARASTRRAACSSRCATSTLERSRRAGLRVPGDRQAEPRGLEQGHRRRARWRATGSSLRALVEKTVGATPTACSSRSTSTASTSRSVHRGRRPRRRPAHAGRVRDRAGGERGRSTSTTTGSRTSSPARSSTLPGEPAARRRGAAARRSPRGDPRARPARHRRASTSASPRTGASTCSRSTRCRRSSRARRCSRRRGAGRPDLQRDDRAILNAAGAALGPAPRAARRRRSKVQPIRVGFTYNVKRIDPRRATTRPSGIRRRRSSRSRTRSRARATSSSTSRRRRTCRACSPKPMST